MSHIPNSAIPHAGGTAELESEQASAPAFSERTSKLVENARANPAIAVAAGAAVIAGLSAAAAIPLVRNRNGNGKTKAGVSKKN